MKNSNLLYSKFILSRLISGIIFIISLTPNTLISQDISTRGEIYNFDINDIFHHEYIGGDGTNGERVITNIEIIDKYYSSDSNIVYYIRDFMRKTISSWNPVWTYTYRIDTIQYANLDLLIQEGEIDTVYSNTNLYNGRLINQFEHDDGDVYYISRYVVGCGVAEWYSFNSSGGESSDYLVYYRKGSEVWGQPLIVDIGENKSKDSELLIYPNPASNTINIEYDKLINGHIEIYSINGTYIEKIELKPESKNIDISKLNMGSYIFKFCFTDKMIYKKIIKK